MPFQSQADLFASRGDLIVMGGRCQEAWLHGVPKAPETPGSRISVNFQSSAQRLRSPANVNWRADRG